MKCTYCNYEWIPKKENPLSCPRCKNRFDRPRRIVGLQIGGTVGPEDTVGMHVPIPDKPGVGVVVSLDSQLFQFDEALQAIAAKIENADPKAEQLQKSVAEALMEKNPENKLKKIYTVVMTGAGITKIASEIIRITKLLGF